MAQIVDHVDFQTILQTAVAPRKTFGIQLLLVDDDQIPIDQRIRYTTPTSWDDEYDLGTVPYDYSDVYFGQAIKADTLLLGRWIASASNPYFVCGPGWEKDYTVWAAIADGEFGVTDGTNTDGVGPCVFTGITAINQIIAILDAALAAVAVPTVTGLNTFTFAIDSTGRLVLTSSQSGSTADTISIVAHPSPSGTAIQTTLMDAGNGTAIAGYDPEEPEEALQAISAIDDSYYNVHIRGATEVQKEDLGNYIETQEKLCDLVTDAAACLNPASIDDLAYNLFSVNATRTLVIWHRDAANAYPDAAAAGRFLPEKEGTFQIEWQDLAKITDSGIGDGTGNYLTAGERLALKDKNCSHIERISPVTFLYNGLTAGGIEKRIMLGRDWYVARNREDIFTLGINVGLSAFDNVTLTAIEEIIWKNANEAIDRRILVNTPERPFTVTLPDADDIDQATRATHELVVFDAFQGWLNVAIHDYKLVGTWTL